MKAELSLMILIFLLATPTAPLTAQDESTFPLAGAGPYDVGERTFTFTDENRNNREVVVSIWYPAQISDDQRVECDNSIIKILRGETYVCITSDVEPETSGGPFPLILSSHGGCDIDCSHTRRGGNQHKSSAMNAHLASYGFVVAAMDHVCDHCLTDRPLDILFVLDQLALGQTNLAEIIDTDTVGVTGLSAGGYTSLALNGSRIDPEYFLNWYEDNPNFVLAHSWAEIEAYRAQFSPPLIEGELWPPFTDDRIQAVMPLVPCNGPLFGERGLATAHVPTFIVAGAHDFICVYDRDAVFMQQHLGAETHYLLTFIDQGHGFVVQPDSEGYLFHFSTAFFGHSLQGLEDYSQYLTAEYVEQFEDLAWGVYEED